MLGIVFTEFFDLVDDVFGEDVLDDIIDAANLPNDGAYTAVGRYEHTDILKLVTALSEKVDIPVPVLVRTFGEHLFGQFVIKYPSFFIDVHDSMNFLSRIEDHIHVEVKKLYPEANLPTFEQEAFEEGKLRLVYSSQRPFADLAEGLIHGCAAHFNESLVIQRQDLEAVSGYSTEFLIQAEVNTSDQTSI